MSDHPTAAQLLTGFAERLYGKEWGAPLARLTGTNERTVRRVRQAVEAGREHPAARGLLAALHEALVALERDVRPHGR